MNTTTTIQLPAVPDEFLTRQRPEGISFCMIVKNEEEQIVACLDSLLHKDEKGFERCVVDELCVIDTGSTDGTWHYITKWAIEHSVPYRIEHRAWRDDFAWARNLSLDMAKYRWTLTLDADERLGLDAHKGLGPELLDLIAKAPTHPNNPALCYLRITSTLDEAGGVGAMSHALPRLFSTNPRLRYVGIVHEALAFDGDPDRPGLAACSIPLPILHLGYRNDVREAKSKHDRNTPLLKRAVALDPDNAFARYNLANDYGRRGDLENALEHYAWMRRLIQQRRAEMLERGEDGHKYVQSYAPLGWAMYALAVSRQYAANRDDTGLSDFALDLCAEGLLLAPGYATLLCAKGEVLATRGRFTEARACWVQAQAMRDQQSPYLLQDEGAMTWKADANIGLTYLQESNPIEAIKPLMRARDAQPQVWANWERLIAAYCAVGAEDEPLSTALLAIEQFTDTPSELDARMIATSLLVRTKKYSEALKIIQAAVMDKDHTALALRAALALRSPPDEAAPWNVGRALKRLYATCRDEPVVQAMALEHIGYYAYLSDSDSVSLFLKATICARWKRPEWERAHLSMVNDDPQSPYYYERMSRLAYLDAEEGRDNHTGLNASDEAIVTMRSGALYVESSIRRALEEFDSAQNG